MRRSTILLAVPLLLAAACGSGDDAGGDSDSTTAVTSAATSAAPTTTSDAPSTTSNADTTATTSSAVSGAPTTAAGPATTVSAIEAIVDDRAPGVTADEIKIGITYPDFEALGDAVDINHGDYEAAYNVVVDSINAAGGIHGRQLVPVFAPVDPSSPTSTDETCTKLTQDEQVFVAVGLFFGESVTCFVSVNDTAVIGGEMTDERLAEAHAPWFAIEGSDTQVDAINKLLELNVLEGRVGVLLNDTDRATYDNRISPLLEEAGVDIAEVAVNDTGLPPDTVLAESTTIFQRFQSANVDTVLALGQGTANVVSDGVTGSGFKPKLVFNNTNGPNATLNDDTRDPSVFEGATAVGVFGPNDAILELEGVTKECFDVVRAAGIEIPVPSTVEPGDPNTLVSALGGCQSLHLLRAMLEGAGEDLNYGTFQTAGYRLGEILLPGEPQPFFYGPPPHADGDRPLYPYVFDADSRQFVRES
jgi:ABC-type branched-subunit amino acid transport system substrate-binding protein